MEYCFDCGKRVWLLKCYLPDRKKPIGVTTISDLSGMVFSSWNKYVNQDFLFQHMVHVLPQTIGTKWSWPRARFFFSFIPLTLFFSSLHRYLKMSNVRLVDWPFGDYKYRIGQYPWIIQCTYLPDAWCPRNLNLDNYYKYQIFGEFYKFVENAFRQAMLF